MREAERLPVPNRQDLAGPVGLALAPFPAVRAAGDDAVGALVVVEEPLVGSPEAVGAAHLAGDVVAEGAAAVDVFADALAGLVARVASELLFVVLLGAVDEQTAPE